MLLDKINTLAAFDNVRQPDPTSVIVPSNQLWHWDQLMNPVNNGTNAELGTTKNGQRFFL
jgi:hypothetical protein